MRIKDLIIAAVLGIAVLAPASISVSAERYWGSVECGQYLKTPEIIGDVKISGTSPKITIGDKGAEDTMLLYDGNAQDFHVALDDSSDKLVIGLGSAAGTTERMTFNSADLNILIGDATAADVALVYDGIAQDFYLGIDDSVDDLTCGVGSALGTTQAWSVDENSVFSIDAAMRYGTNTLTTSADDPIGTGTVSLAQTVTYVITDATGTGADEATIGSGTVEGQKHTVILLQDVETTGLAVVPTTTTMVGGAGTSTLLEDAGDSVSFVWSTELGWTLTSNVGATVQ